MSLITESEMVDGVAVVRCRGPMTFGAQTAELHLYVKEQLEQTKNIIINLDGVPYLDSAGIGVLIGAYISTLIANGKLKLVGLSFKSRRAMERSKLLNFFEVYKTEDDAIAAVKSTAR